MSSSLVVAEFRPALGRFFKYIEKWHPVSCTAAHLALKPAEAGGRTCGMCGVFTQETEGEWKTPEHCAVSSGDLMAASFMVNFVCKHLDKSSHLKIEIF